jgi:DNA mismatch endonuclease (patch repair protein)
VHGCLWHRHEGFRYTTTPKTRQECWLDKFESNVFSNRRNQAKLEQLGWRVLVVWECELREPEALLLRIVETFQPFG